MDKDVDSFTSFVNNVSKGNEYSGTTVYLDSDLSLSGITLGPIRTYLNHFNGVFDGQGFIISNLKMSTTSQYAGLFGYLTGVTIKNAVLDSSCSIESTFSSDSSSGYTGGIIGYCESKSGECNIENSVNMANVTFSGNTGYNLYIGGVVGDLHSSSYSVYVKNCVNYGSVTGSETSCGFTGLGGIVGYSYGSSSSNVYVQNCLNYGTITHKGTTNILVIGGIVGYGYSSTYIENCVSAGKISKETTATKNNYVGSIIGSINSNIHINYCYYTSDVCVSKISGSGTPSSTTGTSNSPTTVDSDLVSNLNNNATSCNWSKWLLNTKNKTVTFIMSDDRKLSFSSQVILTPIPVKEGNSFLFWCKDAECTEEFEASSVSGTTKLYAAWVNSIVTFDFGNRTTVNETFVYNTEIIYLDIEKEGHSLSWVNYHEFMPARDITVTAHWVPNNYTVTFGFDNGTTMNETFTYNTEIIYPNNLPEKEGHTLSWSNYHELMPARDITVTTQWVPNNYTVIFDFSNGTTVNATFTYNTEIIYPVQEGYSLTWSNYHELMSAKNITVTAEWTPNNYTVTFDANGGNVSETSKIVTFNEKYGDTPKPEKSGYMFLGWFTNETNRTFVTNETIVNIPDNHTLYAHWEEVTNYVEIVFSTKDLTREEVENIIRQYTNAKFEITHSENESGEIKAIIKFIDRDDAKEFVESINEQGGSDDFKKAKFVFGDRSFSTTVCPHSFLNTLFL